MEADKIPLTRQGRKGRRDSPVEDRTTLKRLYRILKSEVKRGGAESRGRRRSRSRSRSLDSHEENRPPRDRYYTSCSRSRRKSRGRSLRRYYDSDVGEHRPRGLSQRSWSRKTRSRSRSSSRSYHRGSRSRQYYDTDESEHSLRGMSLCNMVINANGERFVRGTSRFMSARMNSNSSLCLHR